ERMSTHEEQIARDAADLQEKFGYQQELNRGLGTFSSFAVAFSYISPSTGIFTLFFLGMSALGARLWWTWPTVALFQFIVALNIYGVRLVAIVNNTGVVFEILGMVVFAVFLAAVHNQNGAGVIFQSSQAGNYDQFPAATTLPFFLVGMFMSLYVIYGFDTAST